MRVYSPGDVRQTDYWGLLLSQLSLNMRWFLTKIPEVFLQPSHMLTYMQLAHYTRRYTYTIIIQIEHMAKEHEFPTKLFLLYGDLNKNGPIGSYD